MKQQQYLALNPQGYHNITYYEWGDQDNPDVIVCVHGLVRNGRDFDQLAQQLSRQYRVVCPDVAGRGQSDWLPAGIPYHIPQYVQDMVTLLARLNVTQVDWIGTSMGGLIGMVMAAYTGSPIKRMVLNDIGPWVSKQALQRIGSYVGLDQRFDSLEQIKAMYRQNYLAFKRLGEHQWDHITRHGHRVTEDGRLALHYDPAIGDFTRALSDQDADLWPVWQQVTCPQLLLWGGLSDVLTADTVQQMQRLNPDMTVVSWPDIPHAPSLMEDEQIEIVMDWLMSSNSAT